MGCEPRPPSCKMNALVMAPRRQGLVTGGSASGFCVARFGAAPVCPLRPHTAALLPLRPRPLYCPQEGDPEFRVREERRAGKGMASSFPLLQDGPLRSGLVALPRSGHAGR